MKSQPHILFADDDADTRELVSIVLHNAGFRVSLAHESSHIIPLFYSNQFDALILDNWMPGKSGLEICRQIRAIDKDTPILFCSGAVTATDIDTATAAGVQAFIEKPFDPDHLIEVLRSNLKRN